MKNKIFLLSALLCLSISAQAEDYSTIWKSVTGQVPSAGAMVLHPDHYLAFSAPESVLNQIISSASSNADAPSVIDLPQPDGSYRTFRIWKNDLLPEALSAKYPGIYTLTAEAADNHSVTAKIDYTPYGFHAYVFDGAKSYLIDPYSAQADGNYISYYRSDYTRPVNARMGCAVENDGNIKIGAQINLTGDGLPALQRLNGVTRKKYRLALSADSEYCHAVAGANPTKALVLAKMVISTNRVVGVYERELAVTMTLVPNDDTLIFLNYTGTTAYSNNNGSTMLGQNQTKVNARIGTANYDIGHVFSTGGGGIASLGCICKTSTKAQGVTGSPSPVGDAFDIDYVAHEMGHQFGANHTFNSNTGSCSGNAVNSHAYEPASGSTIMAYAGICAPNDYTQHSDAYFHSTSLEEITTYISSATGGLACAVQVPSTNTNATLVPFSASYSIPFKTPFELTAPTAVDPTADTLSYCWEQRNLGDYGSSLALTYYNGPIFRSFNPSTSPTRIFPTLTQLLNNVTAYDAEKLPDVARYLTFKMTERDIYQGYGTYNFPDDTIHLDVINTTIPFSITSPSANDAGWGANTTHTITWNVASTDVAPINAASVDIYLSIDGGYTWPYTLASGVPNNGSATVTLPNASISQSRIKVKGAGNVFFNISGNLDTTGSIVPTKVGTVAPDMMAVVSPNPAKSVLTIALRSGTGIVAADMVNTVGQKVWAGSISGSQTLDVSTWAAGIYYLRMSSTDGKIATQKVVVE